MSNYVDDDALNARVRQQKQEILEKNREHMTLADRLTLRALTLTETIALESVEGPIEIVYRVPLGAEYQQMVKIQRDALRLGTEVRHRIGELVALQGSARDDADLTGKLGEVQVALDALQVQAERNNRRLLEVVADLCVDESITAEFLDAGMLAVDDVGQFVRDIMRTTEERASGARSFRKK